MKRFLISICSALMFSSVLGCGGDLEATMKDSDPQVRLEGVIELGLQGKSAIPELIQALSDDSPMVRRKATENLGRLGADALPAVEPLTKLLQDEAVDVREAAAEAIGMIGPPAKDALPDLQQAYQLALKNREGMLIYKIQEAIERINHQPSA